MHQNIEAFATGVQIVGNNATVTVGGKEQPLLLIDFAPNTDGVHVYTRAGQPWIGRETELNLLHEFRTDPRPFAWWTIVGVGGVGKSRLAFEFARAARAENWRVGFYPLSAHPFAWAQWDILLPTLVVVDDASKRIEEIGELIETLGGIAGKLKFPARLLLIDRHEGFLETLCRNQLRRETYLKPTRFRDPLKLGPLSDPALRQLASELVDGDATEVVDLVMTALERIDPGERRPLYLRFIAEAASRGQNPSDWDRAKLIRDHLKDLEVRRWPTTGQGVTEDDLDEDKRILAFATLTQFLQFNDFSKAAAVGAPLPSQTTPSQRKRLVQMIDVPQLTSWLPPLKPDTLGELFTIDFLAERATWDRDGVQRMLGAGWSLYPTNMWSFFRASFDDWGDDADPVDLLKYLPPLGCRASWARTVSSEIEIRFDVLSHHATAISLLELLGSAYLEELSLDILIAIDESTAKAIETFGETDLDLTLKLVDAAFRLPPPNDTLQSEHQELVDSIELKSDLLAPYGRIFLRLSILSRRFGFGDQRTGRVLQVTEAALSDISKGHPASALGQKYVNEIKTFRSADITIAETKESIRIVDIAIKNMEFTMFRSRIIDLTKLLENGKINDDGIVATLKGTFETLAKIVSVPKPEFFEEATWSGFRFEVMELLKAAARAGLGYEVRDLAASYLSMTAENLTVGFFAGMPVDEAGFRDAFLAIASARPRTSSEVLIQSTNIKESSTAAGQNKD